MGARGTSLAAANQRRLERGVVRGGKTQPDGKNSARGIRRCLVPQLREARKLRGDGSLLAAFRSPHHLHGIYGSPQRQHVSREFCPSRRSTKWLRLTGALWREKRKHIYRGILGNIRTSITSRPSGSTKSSAQTDSPTGKMKLTSSARSRATRTRRDNKNELRKSGWKSQASRAVSFWDITDCSHRESTPEENRSLHHNEQARRV